MPFWLVVIVVLVWIAVNAGFPELNHKDSGKTAQVNQEAKKGTPSECYDTAVDLMEKCLSGFTYDSGSDPYVVLNAMSVDAAVPDTGRKGVTYSDLDSLNRAGTAEGILDKGNLGKSENRESQVWEPAGFKNQKVTIDGKATYPYNRGHLLAYTTTFNLDMDGNPSPGAEGSLDNPKNLTTQTAFSNQKTFPIFEKMVRDGMKKGDYYYQVTPVYIGEELVPRGYWMAGSPVDKTPGDKFSVYVWNVMDGAEINYTTGDVKPSSGIDVPKPERPL